MRKQIELLVSVLALAATMWCQNTNSANTEAQSVILHNDNILGAELRSPNHPSFDIERKKILLQAGGTHELIEQHKNRSVLLHNKSKLAIVGYTTRWILTDASGIESPVLKYSATVGGWRALDALLDPTITENHERIWLAKYNSMVSPGAFRLISPFFNVSTDAMLDKYGFIPTYGGFVEFERQFPIAPKLDVYLDSVVYSDGLCEGPDLLNSCDHLAAEIEALKSLAQRVKDSQKAGATVAAALDGLVQSVGSERQSFPGFSAPHKDLVAYYTSSAMAELLELRVSTGDNEALARILQPQVASFAVHKATK